MANSELIRKALLALLSGKPKVTGKVVAPDPKQLELLGMSPSKRGTLPEEGVGAKARVTDPSEFDSGTNNSHLGIAEPRSNAFQKAAREERKQGIEDDTGPVSAGNVHRDIVVDEDNFQGIAKKGDVISDNEAMQNTGYTLDELLADELSLSQKSRAKKVPRTSEKRPGKLQAESERKPDREGIDFEGEHHTKEVERIRNLKGSDAEKRAAIKASGKAAEINREVQDIIDLFEKKAKPSLRAPGMFDVNKLSKADLKDPLVSQLWKAWQTLSTNAKGARVGDPAALERVRAIGRWLTKGTAKEQREMFPDYDPKRAPIASPSQQVQSFSDQLPNEIVERTRPANNVLIDILKSIGQ